MHTPVRRGTVRRLPRPPPWSPGDDQWLPGTAGARGRCASVTSYRDSTDLIKFGAAGGQADGLTGSGQVMHALWYTASLLLIRVGL